MSDRRQFWCRHLNLALFALFAGLLTLVLLLPCRVTAAAPEVGNPILATRAAGKYWAFQPIRSPEAPSTKQQNWVRNPIDAFILHQLESNHLAPAPPADRRTLIRRVYFDLLGVPPTPDQVAQFIHDPDPKAYEHLVDRLLQSPQYGERWGRHWLDVVRYADSAGFETDLFYDNAWKYRDYVIRSIAADKPFDRFIQEQVAGDELSPDDPDAITATALFCVGPALPEAAMMSSQLEYDWMTDSVDTIGAGILGLTMGCARCHDHKYDPITQSDYYALQAIFGDTDRPYPQKFRDQRIKSINGLLSDAPIPNDKRDDPRCTIETEKQVGGFHLFHRNQPMEVHRLQRGELSKPKEIADPAFPAFLDASGQKAFADVAPDHRRARLARWLTSPGNPLTARVLANRLWTWHFGQGIVRTPNDFGKQGEPPTHPQLLDWLATELTAHNWSLKHLHRLILLSSTYQMQSTAAGPELQIDSEDRLLWHFPRNRLDAEEIRDAMLSCAGTLNPKQFGPPVVPPLSTQELSGWFDAKEKWKATPDPAEQTRRSVYVLERRTFIYPMFAAFDPPEVMSSCPRRLQTTVPTQALTLLNNPVARQQADAFAQRLIKSCKGDDPNQLVTDAWLIAFARKPATDEMERAVKFLDQREQALRERVGGDSVRKAALADLCLAIFNANEFVYVD